MMEKSLKFNASNILKMQHLLGNLNKMIVANLKQHQQVDCGLFLHIYINR